MGLLESRCIIDTISSHSNDFTLMQINKLGMLSDEQMRLTIEMRILTSSRLCLGSTREKTLPVDPDSAYFFFSLERASNSAPVKQVELVSAFSGMIFSSLAIEIAVSFESPVIMITLMPAVLHSWIEPLTSGLTGSLMHT